MSFLGALAGILRPQEVNGSRRLDGSSSTRWRRIMKRQDYEIGMIRLGVMGRNFLLNMADHGLWVAGYDKDSSKVEALRHL